MAVPTILGPETVETGSSPFSFDSLGNVWGGGQTALDATSKVGGVRSIRFSATAEGSAIALKNLAGATTEIYIQARILLPTGMTYPGGFVNPFELRDNTDTARWWFSFEDDAAPHEMTHNGDQGYIAIPGLAPSNSIFRMEFHVKKDATNGRIRMWINNTTEATPTYDSGLMNTGAAAFHKVCFGVGYTSGSVGNFYMDDFAISSSFIGTGVADTPVVPKYSSLMTLGVG